MMPESWKLGTAIRPEECLAALRTIADLDGKTDIAPEHVNEAIQYRTFDRTLWV
jgi:magnesium chelatase family protein